MPTCALVRPSQNHVRCLIGKTRHTVVLQLLFITLSRVASDEEEENCFERRWKNSEEYFEAEDAILMTILLIRRRVAQTLIDWVL
ncbi:hypothetical protein L596_013745 [Steinernema carpocapsae]|uniref:Uncharacterized protein n=1 Tax=Steinernema carpocapsae TaxID=34508 RepID=A0A4U5P1K3_STECR|nr:hypothetical protein L596_013745 [Steinernema carpocapsae]